MQFLASSMKKTGQGAGKLQTVGMVLEIISTAIHDWQCLLWP